MKSKNPGRDALIRAAVYGARMTYAAAAASLELPVGVVAGVAHRTPHRLRRLIAAQA